MKLKLVSKEGKKKLFGDFDGLPSGPVYVPIVFGDDLPQKDYMLYMDKDFYVHLHLKPWDLSLKSKLPCKRALQPNVGLVFFLIVLGFGILDCIDSMNNDGTVDFDLLMERTLAKKLEKTS